MNQRNLQPVIGQSIIVPAAVCDANLIFSSKTNRKPPKNLQELLKLRLLEDNFTDAGNMFIIYKDPDGKLSVVYLHDPLIGPV